jgi:DNA primase
MQKDQNSFQRTSSSSTFGNQGQRKSPKEARPEPLRIPDSFIEEVNERADILSIIEGAVKLKKTGSNNYIGLCPFHTEKSPSFTVTPSKGMYHCFGCGNSGGAITFLVKHDGQTFKEAVKSIANDLGMALPEALQDKPKRVLDGSAADAGADSTQPAGPHIEKTPLYDSMALAARYFRYTLRHDEAAMKYVASRGISAQSLNRFHIGATNDNWQGLQTAFPDYASNENLENCGLVRTKERIDHSSGEISTNRYDVFRSRLMFPVRDTRGRICAFGGRIMSDQMPKYINSPESVIFNKSETLFGLYEARESIRTKKMAIVVEGYIDVIMLSQHGVENVVACMGTSITRQHIEKLFTQSETIVFAFDGDAAGRKAAWRAMQTCVGLIEDAHDLRFLILPQGKDPDNLAREEGAQAFENRARTALSLSEFLISELSLKHNNLNNAEDRARFASEGSEVASRLPYRTKLRNILLQRISQESQTPGSVMKALQAASRSRKSLDKNSIWSILEKMVVAAPSIAIQERALICELLDLDDPQESSINQVLQEAELFLDQEAPSSPQWLIARDSLESASRMIEEHRVRQVKNDLKEKLQNGEISDEQYLRMHIDAG